MRSKTPCAGFLILLLALHPGFAFAQDAQLRIVVVEGEGAINNVKMRVNREVVVEVQDSNRKPVSGAAVAFLLPSQGPGGVFANGSRTLTTTTDTQGRASATGIRPNSQTGKMEIRVTASREGQTASALITQTNVAGPAASTGMSKNTKILLVVAIVGGAAGGIIAGTRGGGSSSTGSTPSGTPGIVITAGAPTVGGPR